MRESEEFLRNGKGDDFEYEHEVDLSAFVVGDDSDENPDESNGGPSHSRHND